MHTLTKRFRPAALALTALLPAACGKQGVELGQGAARTTDLGLGGPGWINTNEGRVIAAAFLDAHNHLAHQMRALAPKDLPEPVKTKKG